MPTTSPASSSARQASISRFSSIRIADLDARSLRRVGRLVREAGRGEHAHATDAVASGARPEQHGQVADATGLTEHQTIGRQGAEAEHVHERIVR